MTIEIEIIKTGVPGPPTISLVEKSLKTILNKFLARTLNLSFYTAITYPFDSSNYIMDNISLTSNLLRISVEESIFFLIYSFFSDMDLSDSFLCLITLLLVT